jgi:membrane protein DedA with SNARE-associated domain
MDNPLQHIQDIIGLYGIIAVFVLCLVEGDITLLLAGAMAHSQVFHESRFWSFLLVLAAGISGGVVGDSIGYFIGRGFANTIKNYKFYQRAQPRIERLTEKFGGAALIISKYIYGIRVAMCISTGVGRMPYLKFLYNDFISCSIWALILATTGYFFGGAITGLIGDIQSAGIVLMIVIVVGVIGFYLLERFWLSKKVELANPETIHGIEEKIHDITENIQEKLHLSQHSMPKPDLPKPDPNETKTEKQEAKAAKASPTEKE